MDQNALGWIGFLPLIFILFFGIVVAGIPFWRICRRAGLSKGLVAVLFVPAVGWLILIWVIAFSDWPIERHNNVVE